MDGLQSSYLIHKLSLEPVVFSRSYRPEGQGKGRKFEFGDPPNQELNKIIRFKTSTVFKILPDVYSVSVQNFTVYELDEKTHDQEF